MSSGYTIKVPTWEREYEGARRRPAVHDSEGSSDTVRIVTTYHLFRVCALRNDKNGVVDETILVKEFEVDPSIFVKASGDQSKRHNA
jgi:hypothetical protein